MLRPLPQPPDNLPVEPQDEPTSAACHLHSARLRLTPAQLDSFRRVLPPPPDTPTWSDEEVTEMVANLVDLVVVLSQIAAAQRRRCGV